MLIAACSSKPSVTEANNSSGGAGAGGVSGGGVTTVPPKLFSTDFNGVCQGATVSRATPYDKAAKTHKVLLLATYKDSLIEQSSSLPDDWMVQFDANSDAYAKIDLVACAVRTNATFVKDCDGYKKDDKETKNIAKLHDATYKVTVREATTGKELGSTEVTAKGDSCPMLMSFEGENDTQDYFPSPPEDALVAFIKPFVQP